jgi:PAS domain S-box-containing protein
MNGAHARIYGYEGPAELIGKTFRLLHPPAVLEHFERDVMPVLADQGHWNGEVIGLRADGSEFDVGLSVTRLDDGDIVCICRDVTDSLEMESEVHDSHARLERLTDRLHAIREEERATISREIHDQLGQTLTGLRLDVAWLKDRLPPEEDELEERAGHALRLISDALDGVRDLAKRFRPASLDDLGLEAAVEAYLRDLGKMTGLEWTVDGQIDGYHLGSRRATAAYRILQEAATNITRHARAARVHVRLWVEDGELRMHVHDDGLGITDEQIESHDSVGLTGMQERARACGGLVTVERADGGGTAVNLSIPLEPTGA